MSGLTDLQNNVAALTAAVNNLKAYVTTLQSQAGDSDTDVETQAQAIAAQTAAINSLLPSAAPTPPPAA